MKIYDDKHIKNVAFVGAHNSGKTTLAETGTIVSIMMWSTIGPLRNAG